MTSRHAGAPTRRYVHSDRVADTLEAGDDTLVLTTNGLVRLSPLGAYLFTTCATPRTVEELVEALVAEFGPPPQGNQTELVEATLEELATAHVVQEVE